MLLCVDFIFLFVFVFRIDGPRLKGREPRKRSVLLDVQRSDLEKNVYKT